VTGGDSLPCAGPDFDSRDLIDFTAEDQLEILLAMEEELQLELVRLVLDAEI
jgi:hypothetical protein